MVGLGQAASLHSLSCALFCVEDSSLGRGQRTVKLRVDGVGAEDTVVMFLYLPNLVWQTENEKLRLDG